MSKEIFLWAVLILLIGCQNSIVNTTLVKSENEITIRKVTSSEIECIYKFYATEPNYIIDFDSDIKVFYALEFNNTYSDSLFIGVSKSPFELFRYDNIMEFNESGGLVSNSCPFNILGKFVSMGKGEKKTFFTLIHSIKRNNAYCKLDYTFYRKRDVKEGFTKSVYVRIDDGNIEMLDSIPLK